MTNKTDRGFAYKFLHHLNLKNSPKGFTLIELLVVVIIIGVLAAIALPNLLGQVAKGRQAEAKNNLGAILRAQQAYRLENLVFATKDNLPMQLSWNYYEIPDIYWLPDPADPDAGKYASTVSTIAQEKYRDDILDYDSGIIQTKAGESMQVICEEISLNSDGDVPNFVVPDDPTYQNPTSISCDPAASKPVK